MISLGFLMACANLPRRLSSLHFGVGSLDVPTLKRFYLCEDLDRRNPAFYDELLRRSKTLVVNGVKFPLPRRLKEQIFYEKVIDENGDCKLRKIPLYAMALARKRARDLESFDRQLREDSERLDSHFDFSDCAPLAVEKALFEARVSRAEAYLLKNKQKDIR